jgi:hypothetical protein
MLSAIEPSNSDKRTLPSEFDDPAIVGADHYIAISLAVELNHTHQLLRECYGG